MLKLLTLPLVCFSSNNFPGEKLTWHMYRSYSNPEIRTAVSGFFSKYSYQGSCWLGPDTRNIWIHRFIGSRIVKGRLLQRASHVERNYKPAFFFFLNRPTRRRVGTWEWLNKTPETQFEHNEWSKFSTYSKTIKKVIIVRKEDWNTNCIESHFQETLRKHFSVWFLRVVPVSQSKLTTEHRSVYVDVVCISTKWLPWIWTLKNTLIFSSVLQNSFQINVFWVDPIRSQICYFFLLTTLP